jgi:hypothetical protein
MSDKMQKVNRVEKEMMQLRNMPGSIKYNKSLSALGTIISVRTRVKLPLPFNTA